MIASEASEVIWGHGARAYHGSISAVRDGVLEIVCLLLASLQCWANSLTLKHARERARDGGRLPRTQSQTTVGTKHMEEWLDRSGH